MNNNRLSTNIVEGESIDRVQLYKDIRNLLAIESYAKTKKSLDLLVGQARKRSLIKVISFSV